MLLGPPPPSPAATYCQAGAAPYAQAGAANCRDYQLATACTQLLSKIKTQDHLNQFNVSQCKWLNKGGAEQADCLGRIGSYPKPTL